MAIDPNWVRENPEEAARQLNLLTKERDQYIAVHQEQNDKIEALILKGEWLAQSARVCECDDMGIQLENWEKAKSALANTRLARRKVKRDK